MRYTSQYFIIIYFTFYKNNSIILNKKRLIKTIIKKHQKREFKMIKLLNGDCLEVMKTIKDHSVDLILCDLPY